MNGIQCICDVVFSSDRQDEHQIPPETIAPGSPAPLRDRLEHLLVELEKRAVKLYADYLQFSACYDTAAPEQREQYDKTICKDHSAFTKLNDMLMGFIIECPDFQQLIALNNTGGCWVLSFFRPWDRSGTLSMPEGMLEYY
jgi:hypothetical protein